MHLLEEIEAKDKVSQECRSAIYQRDTSIQKFVKQSGCCSNNPKEEGYCRSVLANYDRAQALHEEKVALGDKARILVRDEFLLLRETYSKHVLTLD